MTSGAQLTVTELRRAGRHPIDHHAMAEHRRLGEIELRLANISAQGFMIAGDSGLSRGERLVIRLPIVGRIEAHMIWSAGGRAGFQFERIIRLEDFSDLLAQLQPNPRLRPRQV